MKTLIRALCVLICANQYVFAQLTKPAVPISSFTATQQQIAPMSLAERVKRGIVPARGVCSIAPGKGRNDLMISGNGKMRVDESS